MYFWLLHIFGIKCYTQFQFMVEVHTSNKVQFKMINDQQNYLRFFIIKLFTCYAKCIYIACLTHLFIFFFKSKHFNIYNNYQITQYFLYSLIVYCIILM